MAFGLNWADYVVIACIVLSMLISVMRGFVRESLSLASWVLAFWVSLTFVNDVSVYFSNFIDTPSIRLVVAFLSLFLITLVLGSVVSRMVGSVVQKTGLSGTDRMVGIIFGAARGVIVVALLLLLAQMSKLNEDPWWERSATIPYLEPLANWLHSHIPESLDFLKPKSRE